MKLLRLFSDESGESHFGDVEFAMSLLDSAPPAKPVLFTQTERATGWAVVHCPPNWDGGLHTAPRRQLLICTAGSLRMTSSLGDYRELSPGTVVLVEDVQGKGHVSEVTSAVAFEAMVISLE